MTPAEALVLYGPSWLLLGWFFEPPINHLWQRMKGGRK